MQLRKFFLATATIALATSPVLAANPNPPVNPAAKLSISNAVPAVAQGEKSRKRSGGLLIGGLVALAVVVGIVAASGGGDDDSSDSS